MALALTAAAAGMLSTKRLALNSRERDAMYVPRKVEGIWWVGFLYSDGSFDPVASYPSELTAITNASRMNEAMGVALPI
jgi:hypothetical protein